ncbi:MAG: hypothetical protein V3T49_07245 [Dehalococcoidia bacterium]
MATPVFHLRPSHALRHFPREDTFYTQGTAESSEYSPAELVVYEHELEGPGWSAMNYEELDVLIGNAIEERLDDSGWRRLEELLNQGPVALDYYLQQIDVHVELIDIFRKE